MVAVIHIPTWTAKCRDRREARRFRPVGWRFKRVTSAEGLFFMWEWEFDLDRPCQRCGTRLPVVIVNDTPEHGDCVRCHGAA